MLWNEQPNLLPVGSWRGTGVRLPPCPTIYQEQRPAAHILQDPLSLYLAVQFSTQVLMHSLPISKLYPRWHPARVETQSENFHLFRDTLHFWSLTGTHFKVRIHQDSTRLHRAWASLDLNLKWEKLGGSRWTNQVWQNTHFSFWIIVFSSLNW